MAAKDGVDHQAGAVAVGESRVPRLVGTAAPGGLHRTVELGEQVVERLAPSLGMSGRAIGSGDAAGTATDAAATGTSSSGAACSTGATYSTIAESTLAAASTIAASPSSDISALPSITSSTSSTA